ncbi:hypothetical protein ABVK25_011229 [Lepraria finkii]|uniref:Uncharacterized protein n=1 Tax=Lepraria finkii TaxID=1340010 RepID=A0ABR4ARX6_9LECA
MAVVFEIGPDETFLFDTPGGTTTNKLPDALKDVGLGVGIGKTIQQIYCINFGCNGAYFFSARTVNGNIIRRFNLPQQLEAWLIDSGTNTCRRDIPSLRIELGPNGSFYAVDANSYRWHNLPDALEEAIQQRITPAGWTAKPDWVVLGADGAFIYANDRGGHSYALGNYPTLMSLIQSLHQTSLGGHTGFALVQWISMSIYRPGHFIALHRSGHHVADLHPGATHALNSMAATFPKNPLSPIQPAQPTMMAKTSPPTTSSVSPPMMARKSPPVTQAPAFRPAPHTQASAPTLQPQIVRRPVSHTQVTSPLPQSQAVRPVSYNQQQSNGLARLFSDTASQVVSNVITTEITNATSGGGGGGGGRRREEEGGDLLVVSLYLEETAEATMVELLTMQGQTFGHHCRARRVI